jgi:hypothetical protein
MHCIFSKVNFNTLRNFFKLFELKFQCEFYIFNQIYYQSEYQLNRFYNIK